MDLKIRKAIPEDVPHIVRLLADDELGATRETVSDPLSPEYYAAFDAITNDKNSYLMVAVLDEQIVGTLQLNLITYLTYNGGRRGLIEGVRTEKALRGHGIGTSIVKWAIQKSKESGCHLVQLTTDKKRPDALAFYESLGFVASHEGLKLHITM